MRRFRVIKTEIRTVGIDDGAFRSDAKGRVPVVGVVFRGGCWFEGMMYTEVQIDGSDATKQLSSMIMGSSHYQQLRLVMLDGITLAGFNVVDIHELYAKTKLPVVTVTREKPNLTLIHKALMNLPRGEERWRTIRNAGETHEVAMKKRPERVYMQTAGISTSDAKRILKVTSTHSTIPEPLRVAHMIASGIGRT